jgi:anti-anti-sigma factor
MNFTNTTNGSTCNIAIDGKFTFSDNGSFREIIGLFDGKQNTFILDFSAVEFVDSAALGMLLLAREEADKRGITLEIRKPQGQVKKMFNVSKFDTLFNIT